MKSYVFAPSSPLGRVSLSVYWALATPLLLVILAIRWQLQSAEDISDTWYAGVIVLVWMQFCLLCSRLQDNGVPGLIVLPLFVCFAFVLLIDLNPFLLGTDPDDVKENWGLICQIAYAGCGLLAIAWANANLIAGDIDENAYGAPFGETLETARLKRCGRIRERVRAEFSEPAHRPTATAADRVARATAPRTFRPVQR